MKKGQRNKLRASTIGRRTGLDVVQGKKIRRQDDGTDVYEDYWTDSDSTYENETPELMDFPQTRSKQIRENVAILDKDATFRNISKSSSKKSLNQREEHSDEYEYSSPEQSKSSRNKSYSSEDVEDAAISRSKMTQTSHLFDKTENTFSEHRMHGKLHERNEADSTDGKMYSRKTRNSLNVSNQRKNLPSSDDDDDDALVAEISESSGMKSGKKALNKSSKFKTQTSKLFDVTEDSLLKQKSNLFYTARNSSLERSTGVLSKTVSSPSSNKEVNKRYSLRSPIKSSEINQEENKLHEGRRSFNKSGNLVSDEKESEIREKGRRKSSRLKSPVDFKRKRAQTPDDIENSPSKISRLQNRKSKENIKNFPGKNSFQTSNINDVSNKSFEKEADSFYREKILSVERSPRVFSENVSSPSSNNEVNRRYSLRSPVKSSEIINQEENKFYEESRSFNKSGNSVSGEKENELSQKGRRKSSLVKSPVKIKRAQTPDDIENSPLKTSRLQNRKSKENVRNFSGKNSETQVSSSNASHSREDSPSSNDDDELAAGISKSSDMKSGGKAQGKRSDKVESQTSNIFDVANDLSFEKEADSFYREKNLSVERSPRVFSENVSSPSSNNEVNRRYSLRSPMKSSEIINHEENKLYEGSRSLNKSGNLISGEKEKELNEKGGRKSSRLKSPVESKRKRAQPPEDIENSPHKTSRLQNRKSKENVRTLPGNKSHHTSKYSERAQTPDDIENSPHKTSRLQNRKSKENVRNLSGNKSHHTSKYSEASNSKNPISSESDKVVQMSKNLVSSQKGNELDGDFQESFTEESPVVSESNAVQTPDLSENRQVSEGADLNQKTVSPVGSARRKIDFSKAPKNPIKKNASNTKVRSKANFSKTTRKPIQTNASDTDLRISSRGRQIFPRLAYWRNERPKLVRGSPGKEDKFTVDAGRPEDDAAIRALAKQKRKVFQRSAWKKQKNSDEKIPKTTIINIKTDEPVRLRLNRPFELCDWIKPPSEDKPGYMITRSFKSDLITFGFLQIFGRRIKDKQYSNSDNIHFVVLKGNVQLEIHETSSTLKTADSFVVPMGVAYSIKNNVSSPALLGYCSFRVPFFKYQEQE